jgi:hypothetical protein
VTLSKAWFLGKYCLIKPLWLAFNTRAPLFLSFSLLMVLK